MAANVTNPVAFLRTSRNFPEDLKQLSIEVNKAYNDTANAMNVRIIGIFSQNVPSINGEQWFINTTNQKQQGLRQVYPLTTTANIPHGINITANPVVRAWGSFTDGTNYYGFIYGSPTAIAGQIVFYVTPTNIVFSVGAGAPAVTSGLVVLEWLSQI
jgi:hypothetical protein